MTLQNPPRTWSSFRRIAPGYLPASGNRMPSKPQLRKPVFASQAAVYYGLIRGQTHKSPSNCNGGLWPPVFPQQNTGGHRPPLQCSLPSRSIFPGSGRASQQRFAQTVFDRSAERLNDVGIELCAGAALELTESLLARACGPIRTVGCQCVEGISDGDEARAQRDFGASETAGIA